MKKTLALVIALIMVFGCMLSIVPTAEATDAPEAEAPVAKFVPEIAYSNVNYAEGLTLMFAVPAPAAGALEDGASVKVVVWDLESKLYSYNESIATDAVAATATSLEADATKATIGGKEHLVFKYNALTAEMMTDVIYARAVVVNKDNKAISYGDVVDYSVVEYVQTAKGSFAGAPALADANVLALLDSLLNFGSLAQSALNPAEPYTPNGFFANDELHKIWITPVVAGQVKDKVFGGFFKYEDGGFATVCAPFFDGVSVTAYKNAKGEVLEDAYMSSAAEAFGFQIVAENNDIELTIEYEPTAIRGLFAEELGEGFLANNHNQTLVGDSDKLIAAGTNWASASSFVYNKTVKSNFSGQALKPDSYGRMNYYHGARTVADTANPDNLVLMISATGGPTIEFNNTKAADFAGFGFGDTVEDAITIEFEIGRPTPESVVNAGNFYFRNREEAIKVFPDGMKKDTNDTYVFGVKENVVFLDVNDGVSKNSHKRVADIVTIPEIGMVKVAITIFSDGRICSYYSDDKGIMVKGPEAQMAMNQRFAAFNAQYQLDIADDDPTNDANLVNYASFANYLTMNTLNLYWNIGASQYSVRANNKFVDDAYFIKTGTVMIDGVETPLRTGDVPGEGYNAEAIRLYAEQHFSFLVDGYRLFGGAIYE